jgi:hypothetical protein
MKKTIFEHFFPKNGAQKEYGLIEHGTDEKYICEVMNT